MKTKYPKIIKSLLILMAVATGTAYAEQAKTDGKMIPVTGDNYAQAESAANFAKWAKLGSDKQLFHYRELAPVGSAAPTVRMNWDTLYSCRIVKVSDDHTFEVILPKTDMYVSSQVIDENGFSPWNLI